MPALVRRCYRAQQDTFIWIQGKSTSPSIVVVSFVLRRDQKQRKARKWDESEAKYWRIDLLIADSERFGLTGLQSTTVSNWSCKYSCCLASKVRGLSNLLSIAIVHTPASSLANCFPRRKWIWIRTSRYVLGASCFWFVRAFTISWKQHSWF